MVLCHERPPRLSKSSSFFATAHLRTSGLRSMTSPERSNSTQYNPSRGSVPSSLQLLALGVRLVLGGGHRQRQRFGRGLEAEANPGGSARTMVVPLAITNAGAVRERDAAGEASHATAAGAGRTGPAAATAAPAHAAAIPFPRS